jgi:hypothetical protein
MKLPISLIIYDEIHTLVSEEFCKVIEYPFINAVSESVGIELKQSGKEVVGIGIGKEVAVGNELKEIELPMLMSLSATFPIEDQPKRLIHKVFGIPIHCTSKVTEIPVYYRLFKQEDEYKIVNMLVNEIEKENVGKNHGIVMTHTIQASIYAGLYIHHKWKVDVLILRAENELSYYLPHDQEISPYCVDTTLEDLHEKGLGRYIENPFDVAEQARVISGTSIRIKEGFSVQTLTWGIATKFVWSINSRIQMLGRIRRWSEDPVLNKTRRIFLAGIGKPPINYYKKKYQHLNVVDYDFKLEAKLFAEENYVKI